MLANAIGFGQDEEGTWVAELACGHRQHVRHSPPWQLREWTLTEAGREAMLGTPFDCHYCDMASVPQDVLPYRRTDSFTEETVPRALLREHRTKPGTWAHIVVEEGRLEYSCDRGTFILMPGVRGVIEPAVTHHVRPIGAVRFHVVFLRGRVPQHDF
jgi:tellurite methyltransferase